MGTPATSVIYMSLIGLFIILTFILKLVFNTRKDIYYIYTILKIFFLVLFILWMNKYFAGKIQKMLGMADDINNDKDENFFRNTVNLFF